MVDSCLRRAGYRTGLYTKPHLVNLAERTRISGAEIPAGLMLDYIERLRAIYDRAGMALTFFEFTVAMMFLYFAEENVDIAVVESGAWRAAGLHQCCHADPECVTPIGFDHMEYLGYTIAAIAGEKGGIIKHEVPVVIGARDAEARLTLTSIAGQRGSAVRLIDRDFSYTLDAPAHRLDYHGLGLDLRDIELGLAGPFQHENAAIAVATIEALRAQGWRIDEDAIRTGLRDIYWPGRFDIVSKRPLVVLDCAHNEMSIAALLETMSVELGSGGEAAADFRMPVGENMAADGGDARAARARRDFDPGQAETSARAGRSSSRISPHIARRGSSAIRCARSSG